jgi:ribose transport system ATP-binding protein
VTGDVQLAGKPLALQNYGDSIAEGLVYLSEDRKGDGLFLDMSITANVSALRLRQVASAAGIIDDGREAAQAQHLGARLNLKYGSIDQPVSHLSGGNQQKVAIAKMLSVDPKVVFLDEPTRGVDIGAKAEIHRILRDLASRGVGVVVISSELPELIGLCDRVLVVREGRIAGEVSDEDMTEDAIMYLAWVGHQQQQVAS